MSKLDKQFFSKIEYQLGYHCAPFLLGLRGSAMVSVETKNLTELFPFLIKMGIEHRSFYQTNSITVLFLFRREELKKILEEKQRKEALSSFGYSGFSLDEMLLEYKNRFLLYKQGKQEFPHEIGFFLEYPVSDVLNFIKTDGKDAILNGYWKVYEYEEEAKDIFKKYDSARKWVLGFLEKGYKLDCNFSKLKVNMKN